MPNISASNTVHTTSTQSPERSGNLSELGNAFGSSKVEISANSSLTAARDVNSVNSGPDPIPNSAGSVLKIVAASSLESSGVGDIVTLLAGSDELATEKIATVYKHRENQLKTLAKSVTTDISFAVEKYPNTAQLNRLGDNPGQRIFDTLSSLKPDCSQLLVDPAICSATHLDAFADFVKGNKFDDCWQARAEYSKELGTSNVFRAITVKKEVAELVAKNGFEPNLHRNEKSNQNFVPQAMPTSFLAHNHVQSFSGASQYRDFSDPTAAMTPTTSRPSTYSKEAAKKLLELAKSFEQQTKATSLPDSKSQRTIQKNFTESLKKLETALSREADRFDSHTSQKDKIWAHQKCNNMHKSLRGLHLELIKVQLRENDPFQSISFSKGVATAVASDSDMTGVNTKDENITFLYELSVPRLDLIDPEDYMPEKTAPTKFELTHGNGEKTYVEAEKAEKIIFGSLHPSSINSYSEVTERAVMKQMYD